MTHTQLSLDLRAAKSLISNPADWHGALLPEDKWYNKLCVLEAVCKVTGISSRTNRCVDALFEQTAPLRVDEYNDNFEHKDIIGVLDRAIQSAEKIQCQTN